VADCQRSFDDALRAGGTQALPVTDMPGVGIMAYVKDPDGNVFGMIAPTMAPPD
jgi:predicted enzyme related to lactoylglutathione lyase